MIDNVAVTKVDGKIDTLNMTENSQHWELGTLW